MARPKKSGKRATGIQGRSGYLYIIKNNYIIKDGSKTLEKQWISTGLKDTPENIKKASEMRSRLLNKKEAKSTDRCAPTGWGCVFAVGTSTGTPRSLGIS